MGKRLIVFIINVPKLTTLITDFITQLCHQDQLIVGPPPIPTSAGVIACCTEQVF